MNASLLNELIELNNKIIENKFVVIEGEASSGKTTLLEKLK